MTSFLKNDKAFKLNANGESEMIFSPTTKEGIETFSVWDNVEKKFYREGSSLTTSTGTQQVTKFIKLSEDDKKRYARSLKVVREIFFEGNKVLYSFPVGVDAELVGAMKNVEATSNNPFDYEYRVVKTGTGIHTRYTVSIAGKKGVAPSNDLDLEVEDYTPTAEEQKWIDAIVKKYPDYRNRTPSVWAELLTKKMTISLERATNVIKKVLYE